MGGGPRIALRAETRRSLRRPGRRGRPGGPPPRRRRPDGTLALRLDPVDPAALRRVEREVVELEPARELPVARRGAVAPEGRGREPAVPRPGDRGIEDRPALGGAVGEGHADAV